MLEATYKDEQFNRKSVNTDQSAALLLKSDEAFLSLWKKQYRITSDE
jgi:hypothetical protein